MRSLLTLALLAVIVTGTAGADEPGSASCVRIDGVTAFAPRGEVYVRVASDCREEHFEAEDPVLVYLEVLVGERSTRGEDVRVYRDEPRVQRTYEFRDLELAPGDPVLVRLIRFGEILGIATLKVP